MKVHITREQFEQGIIAQDDDNDYSESGYVATIIDGVAHLARYGHCSCFGTFEDVCGGGISDYYEQGEASFVWSGTPDELVAMARGGMDPDMPSRKANAEDYDHDHLEAVYRKIIAWDDRGRVRGEQ